MALEKELLNGINLMREGKEEGFNILYSHTYNFVYGRARMLMKNEEDALDLTQETFIQAYKGIRSLENPENIYAWLGSIAYRQGMKIFRKKKEVLVDEEAEGIFNAIVSADKDIQPEESAEAKALTEIVMGLVEELPELQRAAVVAFYYDNMKIDDIATAFECPVNTIKSRLNYARKFLKERVEDHQRKNNYQLCSFSPAMLIVALRVMFATEKYTISAATAGKIFSAVCGMTGAVATAGATTATTATTVTKSAGAVGKLAASWTAKKTAIAIAVSTISIATAAVAVPMLTEPEAPPAVEMIVPTETPTPEPTVTNTPTPEPTATSTPMPEPTSTPTPTPEIDYYADSIDEYYEILARLVKEDVTELTEVYLHKVVFEEGHNLADSEILQRYAGSYAEIWIRNLDESGEYYTAGVRTPGELTSDGQYYIISMYIEQYNLSTSRLIYAYSEEDYISKLHAALDSRLERIEIRLLGDNMAEMEQFAWNYDAGSDQAVFLEVYDCTSEEGYNVLYRGENNELLMPVNEMLRDRFCIGKSYERIVYLQENELAAHDISEAENVISKWYEEGRTPWVRVYLPVSDFYNEYERENYELLRLESHWHSKYLSNAVWLNTAKEYYSEWFSTAYPESGYVMEYEPLIMGWFSSERDNPRISTRYMSCIIRREDVAFTESERENTVVDWATLFPALTPAPQVQQIPEKDLGEIDAVVLAADIIADIITADMSEIEKAKAVHDYMVMHTDIDYVNYVFDTMSPERSTVESVLGIGYASPEGYAAAFQLLCETAGLESITVNGMLLDGEKPHSWNQVKIDGNWYHVDVMSDDPGRTTKKQEDHRLASYQYFLISDEDMCLTHTVTSVAQICPAPSIANEALMYGCPWEVAGVVSSAEEMEALAKEMFEQERTYFKYISEVDFTDMELQMIIEKLAVEYNREWFSSCLVRTTVPQKIRNGKEWNCYYVLPNLVKETE